MDRQVDDEACALSDLRVREDEPSRLLDDTVDSRKAEACSLSHFLRGEERLKNLAEHAWRNTCAGVNDRKRTVVGDGQDIRAKLGNLVGLHRIGLNGKRSAAFGGHCVARIDRKIDDD